MFFSLEEENKVMIKYKYIYMRINSISFLVSREYTLANRCHILMSQVQSIHLIATGSFNIRILWRSDI